MGVLLSVLTFLIGGFLVYGVHYFIDDAANAWLTIGAILMGVGALSLFIVLTYRASRTLDRRQRITREVDDGDRTDRDDRVGGIPGQWPAENLR